ncbi:MAG: STAS domain-containing protein [Candidatus Eremiobacteraeota bacterium]|nr:STAS domain-containing protein [Candidatus Eremiobacteraeota bacterium]
MATITHLNPEHTHNPINSAAFVRQSSADGETLFVTGEVDLSNADQMAAALEDMLRQPAPLTIDLRHCTYFDSSGLHVVLRAASRAQNGFSLKATHGSTVHRILDLTKLSDRLAATFEPATSMTAKPA